MKSNRLYIYGIILVLVGSLASCIGQPYHEDVVCSRMVQDDQIAEYAGIQDQSEAYCVAVYDGDTITVSTGVKVRLIGIDAPELSEPGGDIARNYLACLVLN
jgi:endonuclease YncB( thermonuclease family)